uniref:Cuticular protein RR family n=1 Tax=Anopheles dirus TaxID=7168 RepID=A0A182N0S2_9DIPT
MIGFKLLTIATCLAGVIVAQDYQEYRQAPLRIGTKAEEPKPTPVPILKQINSNSDRSGYYRKRCFAAVRNNCKLRAGGSKIHSNFIPTGAGGARVNPAPAGTPASAPERASGGFGGPKKFSKLSAALARTPHNEDGSYTYGYEGADGSFKIETKLATGEVKGKYGYVDETGKVKVVEYGANKYGFQPSGEGITVPPPTLVDETTGKDDLLEDDDGNVPVAPRLQKHRPASKPRFQEVPIQQHQPQQRPQQQQQQAYYDYDEQPAPLPQPKYQPAPQYVQRSHFGPAPAQSVGPAPPRAQLANAVPVDVVYAPKQLPARPDVEYRNVGPQTFPGAAPAPEPKIRYSQPSFAPAALPPQQQHQHAPAIKSANPAPLPQGGFPQPRPQPAVYQPRPAQGRSTSVLDQLAKDYALPQGGAAPLHDITFGYY